VTTLFETYASVCLSSETLSSETCLQRHIQVLEDSPFTVTTLYRVLCTGLFSNVFFINVFHRAVSCVFWFLVHPRGAGSAEFVLSKMENKKLNRAREGREEEGERRGKGGCAWRGRQGEVKREKGRGIDQIFPHFHLYHFYEIVTAGFSIILHSLMSLLCFSFAGCETARQIHTI